jgi:3-hydroxy acid dehydrogenase/malonic semialdehyde reductase
MLKNKVVLITGASSGIGAACAEQFARAGARLLLCARRLDMIKKYDADMHTFELDVRDHAAVKKQFAALPAEWKNIDILVNNAGLAAGLDSIQESSVDDWEQMIDTNIKGLLYMTREVLPQMVERNAGHIINIGSIAGHTVYPKGAVYCATKHAVKTLTEGLRMDLFGTRVRVSSVDPGAVETNFSHVRFKGDDARAKAIYTGFEPLQASDVADAVLYCASRAPHINIGDIVITSTDQAAVTMIARK